MRVLSYETLTENRRDSRGVPDLLKLLVRRKPTAHPGETRITKVKTSTGYPLHQKRCTRTATG